MSKAHCTVNAWKLSFFFFFQHSHYIAHFSVAVHWSVDRDWFLGWKKWTTNAWQQINQKAGSNRRTGRLSVNASEAMIQRGYLPVFPNEKWCMEGRPLIKLPLFWQHGARRGSLSTLIHLKTPNSPIFLSLSGALKQQWAELLITSQDSSVLFTYEWLKKLTEDEKHYDFADCLWGGGHLVAAGSSFKICPQ